MEDIKRYCGEYGVESWTGLNWFRVESNGRMFWTP